MANFPGRTWSPGEDLTASLMNAHIRDNFDETAPAIATAPGRLIVTDGANSIVERLPATAAVATSETTTSTSFTDLATSGPSVTATTGTKVLVIMSAEIQNSGSGGTSYVGFAVSGATTAATTTAESYNYESGAAGDRLQASRALLFTVTAGSNTFKLQYKVSAGTGTFNNRYIVVIPF